MIKLTWITGVALASVIAFSSTLQAQTLQEGAWRGVVFLLGGNSMGLPLDVKTGPDGLVMTYNDFAGNTYPVTDVSLEGDTLSFSILSVTGSALDLHHCTLKAQDDECYVGECTDGDGANLRFCLQPRAQDLRFCLQSRAEIALPRLGTPSPRRAGRENRMKAIRVAPDAGGYEVHRVE